MDINSCSFKCAAVAVMLVGIIVASTRPAAAGEGGSAQGGRPAGAFAAADAALAAFISDFPPLALPKDFPLPDAQEAAAKKRHVDPKLRDRFICRGRAFDCRLKEQRNEFFKAARVEISKQAVGLIYHVIGDTDVQQVLLTYDSKGEIVAGLVLSGDFGDMEWGCDGRMGADRKIGVNRYVWVGGSEKEYVKDKRFRITERGAIEETVL